MDKDSRKGSILIVDNTLPTIDLIRTLLEGQGYDVMVATSGEQAIKRVGVKTPDLILLDVCMPGMDGFETCRRLKAEESTRDVPVIFMTALEAMESKVTGFETGAVDYITKPIKVEEVLARVRTHLSLRNMQKELRTQNERFQQVIAQRKLIEDTLRDSEANYRMVIENANDSIIVIQDGVISFANQKALESAGYTADELISRPFVDFLHPDDREMVYERYLQRLGGRTPDPYGFRIVNKKGDCLWVEVNAVLTAWRGRPATLNFLTDITDRKRAEQALRESEAFLSMLLEAVPIPVFYKGKDGRYLGFNRAFEVFFGKEKKELIGKSVFDISPPALAKIYHAQDSRLFEKIGVQVYESQVLDADGVLHDVVFHKASLTDSQGSIIGLIGAILDITERRRAEVALRESETKFRALVEQIPAIVYTAALDQASTTLYISPQIESMIGFSQSEYAEDPDIWRKQLHPEDRDRVLMEVARSHETGEPLRTEYRMRHRDGHAVWLRDEAVIVKGSTGRPLNLQGVMVDISAAKRAEEQIHILNQELIKAHEVERRMISLELHDRVAQDLSTVKIGLDTLLYSQAGASPETKSQVSELSKMVQRSITAVRDLTYDLRPPSLDQLGLVQSIYQYCEDFSEKAGVIVDFTSAGMDDLRLGPDMEINLYRLAQEGLINVRKHAEAAHVVLRLVASFPDIILRIIDDGKGFDVKKRSESLANERRMGLRGMEERVRWLGGVMDIKSSPGKGTRIVIRVPHKEKKDEPEEGPIDRR